MKLSQLLASGTRLYIDTAPLIYYIEEHPNYLAQMEAIVNAIDEGQMFAFSSVITLTEVLTHPLKMSNKQLEQQYRDILLSSATYHLLSVSQDIAADAALLRARYNLRTPDALHIASALDSFCDAFLTNDQGLKRVNELPVLLLDEIEFTTS